MNVYEREREERLARNRQRMQASPPSHQLSVTLAVQLRAAATDTQADPEQDTFQELGLPQLKQALEAKETPTRKTWAARPQATGPARRSGRVTAPKNYSEALLAGETVRQVISRVAPARRSESQAKNDRSDVNTVPTRVVRVQVTHRL